MAEKSSSPLFEGISLYKKGDYTSALTFFISLELIILNLHITLVFAMQNLKDMTMPFCILNRL